MALTKIGSIGINTGIQFAGVTTVSTLNASDNVLSVGGTVNFSGNVSIAGTLTYEDVTNVDSVGLITARAGVNVGSGITLSKDGDGFFTGVVTATSYAGDGSALTGISVDSTQIVTGNTSVQTVDTGSDGHVKINTEGSERLRIIADGKVGIGTDVPTHALDIQGSSGSFTKLALSNQTMNTSKYEVIFGDQGQVNHVVGANREITFATNGSSNERLRIKSDGNIGIGTNNPTDILDINSDSASAVTNMYLRNHANLGGAALNIWTQGNYASPTYKAIIGCSDSGGNIRMGAHSNHDLLLLTNNTERAKITADGYLQQHKLIAVSYSDTRELALNDTDLTTSNFYNYTNFASDSTILDSNGHFVAPVHGIYRLYCRFTTDEGSGNRANVRLRKNGITVNEAYANGAYHSVSSEIIMELDANEYLDIQIAQLHTMSGNQHKVVNFHMLG